MLPTLNSELAAAADSAADPHERHRRSSTLGEGEGFVLAHGQSDAPVGGGWMLANPLFATAAVVHVPTGTKALERIAELTRMRDPRRHVGSDGYMAPLQSCLEGEPDYAEPDLNDAAEHGVLAPTGQATVYSDLRPIDPATLYSELGPPTKQGGRNSSYDAVGQADRNAAESTT